MDECIRIWLLVRDLQSIRPTDSSIGKGSVVRVRTWKIGGFSGRKHTPQSRASVSSTVTPPSAAAALSGRTRDDGGGGGVAASEDSRASGSSTVTPPTAAAALSGRTRDGGGRGGIAASEERPEPWLFLQAPALARPVVDFFPTATTILRCGFSLTGKDSPARSLPMAKLCAKPERSPE
jgi:hypothetical protein